VRGVSESHRQESLAETLIRLQARADQLVAQLHEIEPQPRARAHGPLAKVEMELSAIVATIASLTSGR
jgi:hypothetical protein